jgi:antitoxin component YwqK of YwqJK toxin-antitoxin module
MWYKNGKLHRDCDLPATEYKNGTKMWYKNDCLHRDGDLPAVIRADGTKEWYKAGKLHREGELPSKNGGNMENYMIIPLHTQ